MTTKNTVTENYEVKNVKSMEGMDGIAYSATIYRNGNRVGTVHQSGCGGCNNYQMSADELAILKETAARVEGESYCEIEDVFIGRLCDDYENSKRLRRVCKKQTLFRLTDTEVDSYRTLSQPYDQRIHDHIIKKYGDAVVEILNRNANPVAI